MGLKETLAAKFPAKYWDNFNADFQHNFFDLHMPRTQEYDTILRKKLAGKSVLEVGGFPGLLVSWLMDMDCNVSTIESPDWFPAWYKAWADEKKYDYTIHDITNGAPALEGRWDWITISDVLIHMDGMPIEFLKWACSHCDKLLLSHYPWEHRGADYDENINPAKQHTLRRTWRMPMMREISELIAGFGIRFEERIETIDREILIFGH